MDGLHVKTITFDYVFLDLGLYLFYAGWRLATSLIMIDPYTKKEIFNGRQRRQEG
ncbi:MAG: hypothetical protein ACD_34C00303G0002 [uncultured bacterium]|nr:MAG: hypothetical protein ACD_34C00303G0002 [uncultured bacterium]